MALEVGTKAPDFMLPDKNGTNHSLASASTKYIVLYFYPKDNTPGCSIEAKGFNDLLDDFKKANTTIIGISGGDNESKQKFCEKYDLQFLLLSDENFKVCEKYDVYGEKKFMGRTYMGVNRITYVLDDKKNIIKVYNTVKPPIHPKEVLDFVKHQ